VTGLAAAAMLYRHPPRCRQVSTAAIAATGLVVSSTGSFEDLETHELIEAEDLNPILEQAKGITSQLPSA
jgi:hypothetical protein